MDDIFSVIPRYEEMPEPVAIPTPRKIAAVVQHLAALPQIEMPVTHRFQPGAYLREIFMPAGAFVIGHVHRHRHFNIVLTGRAEVIIGEERTEIAAPAVFESGAGVQKILHILEDMRWITVHANPDDLRDAVKLEERLVILSPEYLELKGCQTLDEARLSVNPTLIKALCPSPSLPLELA